MEKLHTDKASKSKGKLIAMDKQRQRKEAPSVANEAIKNYSKEEQRDIARQSKGKLMKKNIQKERAKGKEIKQKAMGKQGKEITLAICPKHR